MLHPTSESESSELRYQGFPIAVRNGYVRMKDLHIASGEKESKLPTFYLRRFRMISTTET